MPLKNADEYRAYMRRYMRERHARRRAAAIEQLGGRCVDCGTTSCLQFDHDDATSKTADIALLFSRATEARLQEELAKCVLRCADCHIEKSRRAGDLTRWRG